MFAWCGMSQPGMVSRIDSLGLPAMDNMLIRNYADSLMVIHGVDRNDPAQHYFVVESEIVGTLPRYFVCNLRAVFSPHGDTYTVNDMRTYKGKCYFCGTIRSQMWDPVYNHAGEIIDSGLTYIGFIGFFDMNEVLGSGGTIHLSPIPNTERLTRMVVYNDDYDNEIIITAVGTTNENTVPACMVEVKYEIVPSGAWGWTRTMIQPTGCSSEEYLTDIIVTDGRVETVGYALCHDGPYTYDANHYRFRLHECKIYGFYECHAKYGIPETAYIYEIRNPESGIHNNDVNMVMCPMHDETFAVAYNTLRFTDGYGGPLLFTFDGASNMLDAKVIYRDLWGRVKDLAYLHSCDKMAMLTIDEEKPSGAVRVHPCNINDCDGTDCLVRTHNNLQTIDSYNGKYVLIGSSSFFDRPIYKIQQDGTSMTDEDGTTTCLNTAENMCCKMRTTAPTPEVCDWHVFYENIDHVWAITTFSSQTAKEGRMCLKYDEEE